MQRFLWAQAVALAGALPLLAQVTVEVQFDQEHFLRNESLPLRVRIENLSGRTLRLGKDPNWLAFTVEGRDGNILSRTGGLPVTKPFELEASKTATLRADLMPTFNLSQPGRYTVSVTAKIPDLEKEIKTEPKGFDIVSGTKLWEREIGVPASTPPETRKYALEQATFLKQLRLYVRLTDATESTVFRVLPLGVLLSFTTPEAQVDRSSNLHVLFQDRARSFLYCVIATDGELIIRQTWDYTATRPRLRPEQDGRVIVSGGQRRILLSDLPPPRVATTNDTSGPK